MKKFISILTVFLMILALASCGSGTADNSADETTSAETTVDGATVADTDSETEAKQNSNALVAYFSCTGTTKALAEYIADSTGAQLYEITPVDAYTDEDLDYNDDDSRSTKEMNDPNSRPAISGEVENMEQYDTVFIGYPIWWGEAPRIVSTFMESYDFTGKTVIPFCTSSSSGMGSSGDNLEELTSGANWLDGERFGGGESRDEMVSWVNGLDLGITAE